MNLDLSEYDVECVSCHRKTVVNCDGICCSCYEWHEKQRQDLRYIIGGGKKKKKEIIPNDIRWAVWERDDFKCQHCGSRKNLTVDHIIPESKGGPMTMENAQTLCKSCNSRKGAR